METAICTKTSITDLMGLTLAKFTPIRLAALRVFEKMKPEE